MSILESIDWNEARNAYDGRKQIHKDLLNLHSQGKIDRFAELALGVSDNDGNYSAAQHGLGPKVLGLNLNAAKRVFALADQFIPLKDAHQVPKLIKNAGLSYLSIGVGSEVSCMVNPRKCWVANARTIWTHLVIKHNDSISKADLELKLYRDSDATSEMAYEIWSDIHYQLDVALTRTAEDGQRLARVASVTPWQHQVSLG